MVIFNDKSVKYCQGLHSATPKRKDEIGFIKKKTLLQTRNPKKIFYLEFTDILEAMPCLSCLLDYKRKSKSTIISRGSFAKWSRETLDL